MRNYNSQLVALGTDRLDKHTLTLLLGDALGQHLFDNYDPSAISYVNQQGGEVARGLPALVDYMAQNPTAKVFLGGSPRLFDLALEGGGAFGFAHLGTIHAMALRGIWFDRVSGTSAGSIAAALIAGGYKVDLNYKTTTDRPATAALEPSPENSLNQILFDDLFRDFTDFEQRIGKVREIVSDDRSFVPKLVESLIRTAFDLFLQLLALPENAVRLTSTEIQSAYLSIEKKLRDSIFALNIGPLRVGDIPVPIRLPPPKLKDVDDLIDDLTDKFTSLLADPAKEIAFEIRNATGPVTAAFQNRLNRVTEGVADVIADTIIQTLVVKDGNRLDHAMYGLFRLIEFGGFWEGNFVRDWVERHLQQLNVGTGVELDGTRGRAEIRVGGRPVKAVLFKDLKVDLCIVAADMGPLGDQPWQPEPVFFSKRTTPDYPVAEAVRRSISLPFVFIPRRINDGYGNNPADILIRPFESVRTKAENLPSLLDRVGGPARAGNASSYNNARHHNHLLLDGGVFFNLPTAVFRDPSDFVFENKKDTKPIVISNINSTVDSSERPHDVPPTSWPEPIPSLKKIIDGVGDLVAQLFGTTSAAATTGDGFRKLGRAAKFLEGYLLSEHGESEIRSLLQLVPNSLFVDVPLRDPNAKNSSSVEFTSDGRIDAGNFNMSKTTKKWLVKNGFDAAKAAFVQYETEVPELRNKLVLPKSLDPYLHILRISNEALSNEGVIAKSSRSKQGDNPYIDGNFQVAKRNLAPNAIVLGRQSSELGYTIRATWLKIANNTANRQSTAAQFLTFETNLRTRVLVAIDGAPSFATADNGWELLPQRLAITDPNALITPGNNLSPNLLNIFAKRFEKGRVVIPGPRSAAAINNRFAYAVLVYPI